MTKTNDILSTALLALGIGTAQAQPASAPASAPATTQASASCVLVGQPGGRYTANIFDKAASAHGGREQGEATEMSGSLRLAGTATKFFAPGQTGKFVPSDDNMVATGRYTQEEPNAVVTWLGNMLKLPPAKPEPLTYTPLPGRGIEVTVTGWDNGVPRGNCQITSKDKPIGTPLPITGITNYTM